MSVISASHVITAAAAAVWSGHDPVPQKAIIVIRLLLPIQQIKYEA